MATIRPGMSADEAYERMRREAIHHLVVVDDDHIAGVVSERDLGGPRGASFRRDRSVADVMSTGVVTAPRDATIRQAANIMRGRTIGCLPIVDGAKVIGILTITDLLRTVGMRFERLPRGRGTLLTRTARGRGPLREGRGVR